MWNNREQAAQFEQSAAVFESRSKTARTWKDRFNYGAWGALAIAAYVATEQYHQDFNPLGLPDIEDLGVHYFAEFGVPFALALIAKFSASLLSEVQMRNSTNSQDSAKWAERNHQWADEQGESR